ncbi:MAG: hypothetical protein IH850_09840 [Acidobacteria bacterium]|nr:hypothetical protein [Acidobacteriota bacterium]
MKQAFDRAVIHLKTWVLGSFQFKGLVGAGLDQILQGRAFFSQFEIMTRHLDRHARFDVAIGAFQDAQGINLATGIETQNILGGFFV